MSVMTVNNEENPNSVEFYRDQVARIVPATGKIYDITEADTNEHSVALPAGYPENTREILIHPERQSGSGNFRARSTSGDPHSAVTILNDYAGIWVRAAVGLFYYQLSTANDDWDIFAVRYITA